MISPLMVGVNAGQTVDSNYIRQIIVKEIPHLILDRSSCPIVYSCLPMASLLAYRHESVDHKVIEERVN